MQVINLYKYEREGGGVTVSPIKPEGKECAELFRLIADEGKVLTHNGEILGEVIDTENRDGWGEVENRDGWGEVEKPTEEV